MRPFRYTGPLNQFLASPQTQAAAFTPRPAQAIRRQQMQQLPTLRAVEVNYQDFAIR